MPRARPPARRLRQLRNVPDEAPARDATGRLDVGQEHDEEDDDDHHRRREPNAAPAPCHHRLRQHRPPTSGGLLSVVVVLALAAPAAVAPAAAAAVVLAVVVVIVVVVLVFIELATVPPVALVADMCALPVRGLMPGPRPRPGVVEPRLGLRCAFWVPE